MNANTSSATPTANGMFLFLDECHREMQKKLVQLRGLAAQVEADGITPQVRKDAREVLQWFSGAAREHHLDEEKHVFPSLLASGDEAVVQTTHRLIQDHGWLEEDWIEIEPSLSAAADGYNWFDPAVLKQAVEVFEHLYLDHIILEETLAYPQARNLIAQSDVAAMSREMNNRRTKRENKRESKHA